ncbi:MAG: hypothetical protein E7111_05870 [Bacteroidales bacterium]|nr:hypothetical protein [Bacteroidales bacterium]
MKRIFSLLLMPVLMLALSCTAEAADDTLDNSVDENTEVTPPDDGGVEPDCTDQSAGSIADVLKDYSGKTKVSLIGDSISTFEGWLAEGYRSYYPYTNPQTQAAVTKVSQQWWYKLIYDRMSNAVLEKNLAWTGTMVTRSTNEEMKDKHWYGRDFNARVMDTSMGEPDVIFVFGGTNDISSRGVDEGKVTMYPGYQMKSETPPSAEQMKTVFDLADATSTLAQAEALEDRYFIHAYVKLITLLHHKYPKAKVVMLIGDRMFTGAEAAMLSIAEHYKTLYGYRCVNFLDIQSYNGTDVITKVNNPHPDDNGFTVMADYIYKVVGSYIDPLNK